MDFFDMKFSTLFLEKHGKANFDNITKQIIQENSLNYNDSYIEVIFKIAFLEFFGLTHNEIKKMIEDIMSYQQVNIEELYYTHKKSISTIQKYLQVATENPNQ